MTVTRWDVMGGNIGRVTGRSVVLTRRRKKNAAQFRECRRHAAFARTDPLALALLSRFVSFHFQGTNRDLIRTRQTALEDDKFAGDH